MLFYCNCHGSQFSLLFMQFLSRLLLFWILYSEKAFHSQKLIQAIPVGSIKELNLPTNFILSYAVDFSTYSLLLEY